MRYLGNVGIVGAFAHIEPQREEYENIGNCGIPCTCMLNTLLTSRGGNRVILCRLNILIFKCGHQKKNTSCYAILRLEKVERLEMVSVTNCW
mmetsp:Transcript_11120/g.18171  ORF Transcript_11120/g.18171 Transcript_11120/m.18171 type:complete len:92 (+) Transcript_11120:1583-1858(+)